MKKNIELENLKNKELITTHGNNSRFNIKEIKYLIPLKIKIIECFFYFFFMCYDEENFCKKRTGNIEQTLIYGVNINCNNEEEDIPVYFDKEITNEIKEIINHLSKDINLEKVYEIVLDKLLVILKRNHDKIINEGNNSRKYSLIEKEVENILNKNQIRNSEYNQYYIQNYIRNLFKLQQKTILLDFYDLNFKKIQKINYKFPDENKLLIQGKNNLSTINGSFSLGEKLYTSNRNYAMKILGDNFSNNTINNKSLNTKSIEERKKFLCLKNTPSLNIGLLSPLQNCINYKKKQKFLNGDLSRNLKKLKKVDDKKDFSTLNKKKLNNKNNVINCSLSFEEANNTNQLFLKDNSNILSKLNSSKKMNKFI